MDIFLDARVGLVPKPGQSRRAPQGLRLVLAEKATKLADAHGLKTPEAVEKHKGIPKNTARRIMTGSNSTTIDSLQWFADAFHIEPYKLLEGEIPRGESAPPPGVHKHDLSGPVPKPSQGFSQRTGGKSKRNKG